MDNEDLTYAPSGEENKNIFRVKSTDPWNKYGRDILAYRQEGCNPIRVVWYQYQWYELYFAEGRPILGPVRPEIHVVTPTSPEPEKEETSDHSTETEDANERLDTRTLSVSIEPDSSGSTTRGNRSWTLIAEPAVPIDTYT